MTDKTVRRFGLGAMVLFVVLAFAAGWLTGVVSGRRLEERRVARFKSEADIFRARSEELESSLRAIREAAAQATSIEPAESTLVPANPA